MAVAKSTKRAELNDAFIAALADDWEKHGSDVITGLRVSRPEVYASLVAKLVPQRVEVSDGGDSAFDTMTREELENWLVNALAEDIEQAERILAKARALAASGDPIVTILPDDAPASPSSPSRSRGYRGSVAGDQATMTHPVVEDFRKDCLDICELRRNGLLSGKRCKIQGALRWPKIATMVVDPICIQVTLTNGQQQTFSISWAQEFPTTKRPWLLCPSCGERRARLFRGFAGYHCRWCLGLWYASQAVCSRKRQHQKLAKLCTKIDGKPWLYDNSKHITVPKRPAGKHRRRYFKLRAAIADLGPVTPGRGLVAKPKKAARRDRAAEGLRSLR